MRIIYHGSASDLRLSEGDRFEVRASDSSDARTIVRRDFDGTAASLRVDPGGDTDVVFILGGRNRPISSPFVQYSLRWATAILDRMKAAR